MPILALTQINQNLAVSYAAACPPNVMNLPEDVFMQACHQYIRDHQGQNQSAYAPQLMTMILGQNLTRRVSNFFSCLGFAQFYPAQRNYPVLPHSEESQALARRFLPHLSTVNQNLRLSQIRYELLPPQEDRDYFSIIYYVKLPYENIPVPVLGKLYNLARPVLYGTSSDWEAIQIDLDKTTKEPVGMSFETSNYFNDPSSFNTLSRKDLHLVAKISKMPNGTWLHTVQQKNAQIQSSEVQNPFREGTHVQMAFVSWNSMFDLCDRVKQNSALQVYPLESHEPEFLDIDTFRKEGIDLRVGWLQSRKLGKFNMKLPARI